MSRISALYIVDRFFRLAELFVHGQDSSADILLSLFFSPSSLFFRPPVMSPSTPPPLPIHATCIVFHSGFFLLVVVVFSARCSGLLLVWIICGAPLVTTYLPF